MENYKNESNFSYCNPARIVLKRGLKAGADPEFSSGRGAALKLQQYEKNTEPKQKPSELGWHVYRVLRSFTLEHVPKDLLAQLAKANREKMTEASITSSYSRKCIA